MGWRDEWPTMLGGSDFDGKQLLCLVRQGQSPFEGLWDVSLLIREIEENLPAKVVDIPLMFEVAAYKLLDSERDIMVSRLLYHRAPVQDPGPRLKIPEGIHGRRLLVFEMAAGENNVWSELCPHSKDLLLAQAARIRASLFKSNVPLSFASEWFLPRLFEQKPKTLPTSVAPTREFCLSLFTSKIEATIKNVGDMIGWEDDHQKVVPVAAAAQQSLLKLVPFIVPVETGQARLYRLVLDHGDFGSHNMSINLDTNGQPTITSLYHWETGCIVPAILSDPLMAVTVDLIINDNGAPSITRITEDDGPTEIVEYVTWSRRYFQVLFAEAPEYERAIEAGKDARRLWFAL